MRGIIYSYNNTKQSAEKPHFCFYFLYFFRLNAKAKEMKISVSDIFYWIGQTALAHVFHGNVFCAACLKNFADLGNGWSYFSFSQCAWQDTKHFVMIHNYLPKKLILWILRQI